MFIVNNIYKLRRKHWDIQKQLLKTWNKKHKTRLNTLNGMVWWSKSVYSHIDLDLNQETPTLRAHLPFYNPNRGSIRLRTFYFPLNPLFTIYEYKIYIYTYKFIKFLVAHWKLSVVQVPPLARGWRVRVYRIVAKGFDYISIYGLWLF